jgi:hypothetical protein
MSSYSSLSAGMGTHSPYGSGDLSYNESTGYIAPQPPVKKSGASNWIKISVPLLVVNIVGAVLDGILGSRKTNNASSSSARQANASLAASIKNDIRHYATATNSLYLVPLNTAAFTTPTFTSSSNLRGHKILSNCQVLTLLQPARTEAPIECSLVATAGWTKVKEALILQPLELVSY